MRFRTRLFLALAAAALIPVAVLAWGMRREMTTRLERDAAERAAVTAARVRRALAEEERRIGEALAVQAATLEEENRFRLAVLADDPAARRWLLDWAGGAMRGGGLDLLRLHDAGGRILSSGHFRNEYGQTGTLGDSGLAVLRARGPAGTLLVLAARETVTVAGERFTLVGGRALDAERLAGTAAPGGASGASATLLLPGSPAPAGDVIETIALPFLDEIAGHTGTARIVITRELGELAALRRRLDAWVLIVAGATLLGALALAAWLAARIARPIGELAEKTARVDLDRLDQRFASDRDDEIGALANLLDAMTIRLRRSALQLREAERRAVTGDLARQVNHDIKNGLAPIRHVLRHLTQVAASDPAGLAAIYEERRGTLESSVEYLENLAREYARLSPATGRGVTHPAAVLRDAAAAVSAPHARIVLELADDTPAVRADAVVLRRIVDNLVANAVDALEGRDGTVTLASAPAGEGAHRAARIVVADTGRGMTGEQLDRAFQDFYTTKAQGTGLGLSVVRRLVQDLGGTLRVETAPERGSRFVVELPAG